MLKIYAKPGKPVPLGRRGENLSRVITFDVREWQMLYGPGTVQLLAQRDGDIAPYPVPITMDGTEALWAIRDVDVAYPGRNGVCELSYYVGNQITKSATYKTIVEKALSAPIESPPEPAQDWLDQVVAAGAKAEAAADRAETAAIKQPIIQKGTWWTWDAESGEYSDTGTPASGGSGGTGNISSDQVSSIVVLDRAEYDALEEKDPAALYCIKG